MGYLKPPAADVPAIEVDRLEHPSPFMPLGAKGVGEGGAIPGPAAVANAVEDALAIIRSLPHHARARLALDPVVHRSPSPAQGVRGTNTT